jgi:hypothetical protein
MACGTAREVVTSVGIISSRLATWTISTLGDCAATAEPTTEHTGQICESDGEAVMSMQKWSCAPRSRTPRSNTKNGRLSGLRSIYLIRRRLGRNGCGVKDLQVSSDYLQETHWPSSASTVLR